VASTIRWVQSFMHLSHLLLETRSSADQRILSSFRILQLIFPWGWFGFSCNSGFDYSPRRGQMDTMRYICISFIFRDCKDMVNMKDDGAGTMAKSEHTYYLICLFVLFSFYVLHPEGVCRLRQKKPAATPTCKPQQKKSPAPSVRCAQISGYGSPLQRK
jgi:hypothetical protein